jgi:hypothetical protein
MANSANSSFSPPSENDQDKNTWLELSKQKFINHHTLESKTMWRFYCSKCKIPVCAQCSIVYQYRLHLGKVYYDETLIGTPKKTSTEPISQLYCEACIHEIGNFMNVSFSDGLIDVREKEFATREEREKNVSIQMEKQEKEENLELELQVLKAKSELDKYKMSNFYCSDGEEIEENRDGKIHLLDSY